MDTKIITIVKIEMSSKLRDALALSEYILDKFWNLK